MSAFDAARPTRLSAQVTSLAGAESSGSGIGVWLVPVAVVTAIVVVVAVGWFTISATRRVRAFARSTDIVPGRPSAAPTAWSRSTDSAALIHRRMRYAMALLHSADGPARHERSAAALAALDERVLDLDRRLADADDLAPFENAATALERLPTRLAVITLGEAEGVIRAVADYVRNPVIPPDPDESAYPIDDYDS